MASCELVLKLQAKVDPWIWYSDDPGRTHMDARIAAAATARRRSAFFRQKALNQ